VQRRKLEAVAEALIKTSGYHVPEGKLYQTRNPGGLLAYSPAQQRDEEGMRVFNSVLDGFQALLFDVGLKLEGKSRAHLRPDQTLTDFAAAYNQPLAAQAWAAFLRKALHDPNITHKTKIEFFLIGD